jgi:hypothetical protein
MNEYNHSHSYEEGSKAKSRNVTFKKYFGQITLSN